MIDFDILKRRKEIFARATGVGEIHCSNVLRYNIKKYWNGGDELWKESV